MTIRQYDSEREGEMSDMDLLFLTIICLSIGCFALGFHIGYYYRRWEK